MPAILIECEQTMGLTAIMPHIAWGTPIRDIFQIFRAEVSGMQITMAFMMGSIAASIAGDNS